MKKAIVFVQGSLTEQDREIIRCLDDRRFTVEYIEGALQNELDDDNLTEAMSALGFLQAVRCLQKLGSAC